MISSPKLRAAAYVLVSLTALLATGSQLGTYLPLGLLEGNMRFWSDTLANPASRFITIDIMFVFLVVWHWMLSEARRLCMRGITWYFLGALLIAFCATLPLFMLHRERAMMARGEQPTSIGDWSANATVLMVALACLAYTWRAMH